MHSDDFNKRWGINDNSSYAEEFEKFRQRILNYFKDIDLELSEVEVIGFCSILGIAYHSWNYGDVYKILKAESSEINFYKTLETLANLPVEPKRNYPGGLIKFSRKNIIDRIVFAIRISKVNVTFKVLKEEFLLYPAGEKILDNELIEKVFSYLNLESNFHYSDALKNYQDKKHIKSAESLRRALEEYLRFKLNNHKGLDNNIAELLSSCKKDGRDPQIRNIISQVINYLDQYFNENSKHNDGDIDETENEYLIYQTGLLLRYISKVIK